MLTKLMLFAAQAFISSWLENGLTIPINVEPFFIDDISSAEIGWLVISKSDFSRHSDLEELLRPRFSKTLSSELIPSPMPRSKFISTFRLVKALMVSGWIGDLWSFGSLDFNAEIITIIF